MNHERFKSMKYSGYQQFLTFRDSAFYLQGVPMGFLYSVFFFFGYSLCLWIFCILRFAYGMCSCVSYILPFAYRLCLWICYILRVAYGVCLQVSPILCFAYRVCLCICYILRFAYRMCFLVSCILSFAYRVCLWVVCIIQIHYFLKQNSLSSICNRDLVLFCQVGPEILYILHMNLTL